MARSTSNLSQLFESIKDFSLKGSHVVGSSLGPAEKHVKF